MTVDQAPTEMEMRDSEAPTPETPEELAAYIQSLVDRGHDYGTCVYAMSLAATAAYNFVAHKLGVTGFQASCADLDILRRNRRYEGPFMILDGSNVVYPQYDLVRDATDAVEKWTKTWGREKAIELLAEQREGEIAPASTVVEHWEKLAAQPESDDAKGTDS